jgi:pyrroline-5-carboxylate reductase
LVIKFNYRNCPNSLSGLWQLGQNSILHECSSNNLTYLRSMSTKIAIIGGGNIGVALAKGLVKSGDYKTSEIAITRRRTGKLDEMAFDGYRVSSDNKVAVEDTKIIVLAILPQQLDEVLADVKDHITEKHLIISVVSGVSIEDIKASLGDNMQVVRAMPNTAISIGESMTCIASSANSSGRMEEVIAIFETVGITMVINEDQMTSATALCACGIAFFLRSIRAASQGGTEIEFHASDALRMAAQTAKGAAALLLEHNTHPEDEIDRVTSPKGCTIAGLNQMEHHGFSSAFIKGITTSAKKAGGLYTNE